jgi:hypothetical protein
LVAADEDEALAAFGEPDDLTNPAQVAYLWRVGLNSDLDVTQALTFDASAWGDYQWAIDMLADKSFASKVIPAVDAPGRVVFIRFVSGVAAAAQVFSPYVTAATFLMANVQSWLLGTGTVADDDPQRDAVAEQLAWPAGRRQLLGVANRGPAPDTRLSTTPRLARAGIGC